MRIYLPKACAADTVKLCIDSQFYWLSMPGKYYKNKRMKECTLAWMTAGHNEGVAGPVIFNKN